jgi:Replication-relaxation
MTSAQRRSSSRRSASLGGRDRAVLSTVGSLRLVTGGQLQRLFFSGEHGSANQRIARRVLQQLTDLGLLLRLERRVGGIRAGSSSYVYALSPRGGRAIQLEVGRGRQREPSLTFVRHTLAVAETCVRLHEARRAARIDTLDIQPEPRCWRSLGGYSGGILKPDLFVVAAAGNEEHLAFVEVDNGTEHGPAILRKAHVYELYFRSGREQSRHGVFPRVIWLVPDERRRDRLRQVLGSDRGLTAGLHRVSLQVDPAGALLAVDE